MTQHVFKTTYEGKTTHVILNCDPPLQGFSMVIPKPVSTVEKISGRDYLYSNLHDPGLSRGFSMSTQYYRAILEQFHIDVPEYIFDEIHKDETCFRENRFVTYWVENNRLFADEEGVVSESELSESPH